jgi:membrane-bound lytic murein transglycosylase B
MLAKTCKTIFFISSAFLWTSGVYAIDVNRCESLSNSKNDISQEERSFLLECQRHYEEESIKIEKELDGKKGERKTLENELTVITAKVNQSKNRIAQTATQIKKISGDIKQKEKKIDTLNDKINKNKIYLTESLSEMRKLDDIRAVIALSKDETFSEVFEGVGEYKAVQGRLTENMDGLKTNKKFIEVEKEVLLDKKDETEALKRKQEEDKKEEERRSKEKKELITITKQQEKDFQKVLDEKKKKVAEIKAKLFSFAGGQTAAIPFETALQHAELAQAQTGVPAAFVLAILTQESALGANVGKCFLTDTVTGAGVNTKNNAVMSKVMKPGRDVQPFIDITSSLGMDWKKTIVSCPIVGVSGWGGAMGPAQFIASTWKLVASRVQTITGSSNPWNARDAIVASATYLRDLNASSSYLSQIKAACRYYGTGGSNCSYGRQVMSRVSRIQSDIDYIKQYGTAKN